MDTATLTAQFERLGVRRGMDLLVHSSLRAVGPIDGGADAVIDVLLDLLGPDGTLMMSTVSGGVHPEQPVFHVSHTPSTSGVLTNVFRARPGAVRSLHPVHSIAALGARAAFYTSGHLEARTPWSPDSPYGKLMRHGGWILFLGTDFTCNTCLHALEIEARIPGLHTERTTTLYVFDVAHSLHSIDHHWHAPKRDHYCSLEHLVAAADGLTYGTIGHGISRLADAAALRATLLPVFLHTPERAITRLSASEFIWE